MTFAPITDEALAEAFRPYSWGDGVTPTPRTTMARGLLDRAGGFAIGGTLRGCLVRLGLLTPVQGNLTMRGRLALHDHFAPFVERGQS